MNYPIWELPAPGLLIAFVAIVHVFISHFAVGGGLFLVVTERKARREQDAALLAYVRTHTRFFALLTLVLGAITGVGIWFTIGLVNPAATSSLINTFVWGWAIEWTFFVVEIAAAMVYLYGWDRLPPSTHMAVGWIYFWSAWLSLVVINGILSFMLTPGAWLTTGSFWDGIFNPTYLPSVVARTAAAVGLAGIYALLTARRQPDRALKQTIARYAILAWVAPMAIVLPVSIVWFVAAAGAAGVPVREIVGAAEPSWTAVAGAVARGARTGHPIAQSALRAVLAASLAALTLCGAVLLRRGRYGRPLVASVMLCAFVAFGAGEWIREDLRKPYVIGGYMFVNGVRTGSGPLRPHAALASSDTFTVDSLNATGVLPATVWRRLPDASAAGAGAQLAADGREVFRLLCSQCHTLDGYLAMRPLVAGVGPPAIDAMLGRLQTWRGRRMPPFTGLPEERRALAVYLATVGGMSAAGAARALAPPAGEDDGHSLFETNCSMCHGRDAQFPFSSFAPRRRTAQDLFEMLGRLPQVNGMMPPLEASEAERRALAEYLMRLTEAAKGAPR